MVVVDFDLICFFLLSRWRWFLTHWIFCVSRKCDVAKWGWMDGWSILFCIKKNEFFNFCHSQLTDSNCLLFQIRLNLWWSIDRTEFKKLNRNSETKTAVFPLFDLSTNDNIVNIDLVSFRSITEFHVIFFFMKIIKKKSLWFLP